MSSNCANTLFPVTATHLVVIKNYHDDNMHVIVQSKAHADESFAGSGKIIYRVRDQQVLHETSATTHSSYIDNIKALIYHLHFGDVREPSVPGGVR